MDDNLISIDNSMIFLKFENNDIYSPTIGTDYSPEKITNSYWYKQDEHNYAYNLTKNNDCSSTDTSDDGTHFIPFTPAQTDEVVTKLGEGWTKKTVTYHDVEQDKDVEIDIPWLKMDEQ